MKTKKSTLALAALAALPLVFAACGDESGNTHEHIWGNWTVTTPPTCTTEGVETRTCTEDGTTETRPISALGHDYQWVVTTYPTEIVNGEFADCTETGTCKHDSTHIDTRLVSYQSLYRNRWFYRSEFDSNTYTRLNIYSNSLDCTIYMHSNLLSSEFTLTDLTWTAIANDEERGSLAEYYPVGYSITGTVTESYYRLGPVLHQPKTVFVFLSKNDPTRLRFYDTTDEVTSGNTLSLQ